MPSNVPGSSQDRPRIVPGTSSTPKWRHQACQMTPIGTINLRTGCKIAINTLTLPYGTSPELWKKWGRQQPLIAIHFTMCVLVWVFERRSLATPFLPSKMKCLFHTAGEILGAPSGSTTSGSAASAVRPLQYGILVGPTGGK